MATLGKTSDFPLQSDIAMTTATSMVPINIVHELGADNSGTTVRQQHFIQPSDTPTIVSVSSTVVAGGSRRMNSPEYLATVRRRKAGRIRLAVLGLQKRAQFDDFEAYTYKVVEDIRELLSQLASSEREGNSSEILRQIRDTFLDGGYEQYKKSGVREVVTAILQRLSEAEEVYPENVDRAWDSLYDGGIMTKLPAVFRVDDQGCATGG